MVTSKLVSKAGPVWDGLLGVALFLLLGVALPQAPSTRVWPRGKWILPLGLWKHCASPSRLTPRCGSS